MTPCTINGKPTLRFVKTEQKALVTVAGLVHALSYYDSCFTNISMELKHLVASLDEDGVYVPPPAAEVK